MRGEEGSRVCQDRRKKDSRAVDPRSFSFSLSLSLSSFFFYRIRSSVTLIIYDTRVAPLPWHFIPLSFYRTRGRFLPRVLQVLAVKG